MPMESSPIVHWGGINERLKRGSMPGEGLKDLGADDSGLDKTVPSRLKRLRPSNVKFRQPWEPLPNAKARGPEMAEKP